MLPGPSYNRIGQSLLSQGTAVKRRAAHSEVSLGAPATRDLPTSSLACRNSWEPIARRQARDVHPRPHLRHADSTPRTFACHPPMACRALGACTGRPVHAPTIYAWTAASSGTFHATCSSRVNQRGDFPHDARFWICDRICTCPVHVDL